MLQSTLHPKPRQAAFYREVVRTVQHWNDSLFSFTTTRAPEFRFVNGQFVMLGLEVDGRPLMRAYSVVSASYEEHLEYLSIKVPNGPLTSRLKELRAGDTVLLGSKPTGTLLVSDLLPGRTLYLLATGTGIAPFLSIIRDPYTYERFEKVVLLHGVRYVNELAYRSYITEELPHHELVGEMARRQLVYYPSVTREAFHHQGRLTTAIETGTLFSDIGTLPLDPQRDRAMICGSPSMVESLRALLDGQGFEVSRGIGMPGGYVFERAFVQA